MSGSDRPVWPAYLLTIFVAGLGHAYLGRWRRGAGWFVVYAIAVAFLSARSLSGALEPGNPFFVTALQVESVSFADVAVPLAVLVACLLDVSLLAIATETGEPVEQNPGGSE